MQHQIAQACHGAFESGRSFNRNNTIPDSIIIIGVKNQRELNKAYNRLINSGIRCEMFFEPDWEYGNTSFGTEALDSEQREILKRYQLWKP